MGRRHRRAEASTSSRLRRSLRLAPRMLTLPRADGLFAIKTFCCSKRPNGRFRQRNILVANKPRRPSAVTRHSAAQEEVRFIRTLEALWRVDGDRAARRRGVESNGADIVEAQAIWKARDRKS